MQIYTFSRIKQAYYYIFSRIKLVICYTFSMIKPAPSHLANRRYQFLSIIVLRVVEECVGFVHFLNLAVIHHYYSIGHKSYYA